MKNDFLAFSRQKSTSLSFSLRYQYFRKSLFVKILKFEKILIFTLLVFIPYDCQNAWDELDAQIKENVEIIFVKHYSDIQNELFPQQF